MIDPEDWRVGIPDDLTNRRFNKTELMIIREALVFYQQCLCNLRFSEVTSYDDRDYLDCLNDLVSLFSGDDDYIF